MRNSWHGRDRWGFGARDVVAPTSLWHGVDDDLVPATWSRQMADEVAHVALNVVPGQGTSWPTRGGMRSLRRSRRSPDRRSVLTPSVASGAPRRSRENRHGAPLSVSVRHKQLAIAAIVCAAPEGFR